VHVHPRHSLGTPASRLRGMGENRGWLGHGQRGAEPAASWQLRLVGVVEVCRAGTPEAPDIGSRKARTLLALLGARHGSVVAVDRIVDALWGDDPPRRPEANVATLVSRLRARFGSEMIVGDRSGYRLDETTRVDLSDAAGLIAEAETWLRGGEPALCLLAAGQGLQLLGGGLVLADHPTAPWAERARVLQAGLLHRAWHAAAEGALRTGDPGRAQVLAEAAIAADPLDEARLPRVDAGLRRRRRAGQSSPGLPAAAHHAGRRTRDRPGPSHPRPARRDTAGQRRDSHSSLIGRERFGYDAVATTRSARRNGVSHETGLAAVTRPCWPLWSGHPYEHRFAVELSGHLDRTGE
jgi:DNA-binding SARP family transcriptional activator